MKKYILFSPIGSTDPITNGRDGSMLHICRKYKPDAVMLFLSSEMAEHQKKDDRYRKAIELLEKDADFHTVIITEERPGLKDVQDFESCLAEFRPLLEKFHAMYPDHEMLVNISSGTPAMKGILYMLAAFLPFKVTLVQTSTPLKSQNPRRGIIEDYDVETEWKNNFDNDAEIYEDRCAEIKAPDFALEIQKNNILNLIDSYEYSAALKLAEEINPPVKSEVLELLREAEHNKEADALTDSAKRISSKMNEYPEYKDIGTSAHKLFRQAVDALNSSAEAAELNESAKSACDEMNEKIRKALNGN